MTFFCEVRSQVPADMVGSEARVLGSRAEPTAGGQASAHCLLPEASTAALLHMEADSSDMLFYSIPSTEAIILVSLILLTPCLLSCYVHSLK